MLGAFCYVSLMQYRHKSQNKAETVAETGPSIFGFIPVTIQADQDKDTTQWNCFWPFLYLSTVPKQSLSSEHEAAADHSLSSHPGFNYVHQLYARVVTIARH